jgi:hypothetical protein
MLLPVGHRQAYGFGKSGYRRNIERARTNFPLLSAAVRERGHVEITLSNQRTHTHRTTDLVATQRRCS